MAAPNIYAFKSLKSTFVPYETAITSVITEAIASQEDLFFLEIGANDGKADMLHSLLCTPEARTWKGLFVEPIPIYFEELKRNYESQSNQFSFENVAITEEDKKVPMYMINEEYAQTIIQKHGAKARWIRKLASLEREHLEKHKHYDVHNHIEQVQIEGITIKTLLRRHEISAIDLLFIDTEGFDARIICAFPFNQYQPKAILWEHRHLKLWQKVQAEKLVMENNYELRVFEYDTVATLRNPDSEPIE